MHVLGSTSLPFPSLAKIYILIVVLEKAVLCSIGGKKAKQITGYRVGGFGILNSRFGFGVFFFVLSAISKNHLQVKKRVTNNKKLNLAQLCRKGRSCSF